MATETDTIGGFPYAYPSCKGCGKPLELANAWMTDGCPCNTPLGINSMNETRWRLLMQLQQDQSREIARLRADVERMPIFRAALEQVAVRCNCGCQQYARESLCPEGGKKLLEMLNGPERRVRADLARLKEENERMREALKPVVAEINNRWADVHDESWNADYHCEFSITVAECRLITAALGEQGQTPTKGGQSNG